MASCYGKLCMLIAILLAGCNQNASNPGDQIGQRKLSPKPELNLPDSATTTELIDALVTVSQPGVGYTGGSSGTEFLPYQGTRTVGIVLLGAGYTSGSSNLRQIVKRGAAVVPELLKHIDDDRPINMQSMSGMMWMDFTDEYDFNRRLRSSPPEGVNFDKFLANSETAPRKHAITVGDLCFVALGQIVNRNFSAVRYQATGGLVVNSPTYSELLRKVILADWSKFTADRHHRMLVDDFASADHEFRRIGAYQRLAYYYPDAVEELVLTELSMPTFNVFTVESFCRETLYKTQTLDAQKLKYEEFIREHGDAFAAGVMDQLFHDLAWGWTADTSPEDTPYKGHPRKLLVHLFQQPEDVDIADQPIRDVPSASERARLIGALVHDRSQRIGDVVMRQYEQSPDEEYFASNCLRCLANRGYGEFLVKQLDNINLTEFRAKSLHLEYMRAISTSADEIVRARLFEILKTTTNPAYFIVALPCADDSQRERVFELAISVLEGLPADTDYGQSLLTMIGDRYPEKAESVYKTFLQTGSAKRADTICKVLWYGKPISVAVLSPLLDDKRPLPDLTVPIRVCDRAAEAISNTTDDISFDSSWSIAAKDKNILLIKQYSEQHTR